MNVLSLALVIGLSGQAQSGDAKGSGSHIAKAFGIAIGDFDVDGRPDLFVTSFHPKRRGRGVVIADFDSDGDLDIWVANERPAKRTKQKNDLIIRVKNGQVEIKGDVIKINGGSVEIIRRAR